MNRSIKNSTDKLSLIYMPVLGVLFLAGIASRLFELTLLVVQHGISIVGFKDIVSAISTDLQLIFLVSIPLFFMLHFLSRKGDSVMLLIISIVTGILTAVSSLLSIYYTATLTPLGPEIWAYSLSEMIDTVIAAESYIEIKLTVFVIFTGIFIAVLYRMLKWMASFSYQPRLNFIGSILLATVLGSIFLAFQTPGPNHFSSNKLSFLVKSGLGEASESIVEFQPSEHSEFPFLRPTSQEDVLGPFFKEITKPPNIVFLLVESLGGEFVGINGNWSGFAPFIDSLAEKGLYWENGLSLSGRTFGMIPTLMGSLPPIENGFMELGPDYPAHSSFIQLLGENGYHTSYYSGYNTYFDGLQYFLDYQNTDVIVNKDWISSTFESDYSKGETYWGYDDKSLFEIASITSKSIQAEPKLEIFHTLQSHSPFTIPNEDEYALKFDGILKQLPVSESRKESFYTYRSELTSLLFTDDALRNFMTEYKKRDSYSNTIFVITGDHWLIPIPQTSRISRYHTPIIFFSELIKEPVRFKSVNTHANIVPALVAFLENSANLSMPDSVHWMGNTMDTALEFQNIHSLPLMQNKSQTTDYISGSYFLNNDILFQLNEGLELTQVSDPDKKDELSRALSFIQSKSTYAAKNNKLYPELNDSTTRNDYEFIIEYKDMFDKIDSLQLGVDEQFEIARKHALDGDYDMARAVARRLLLVASDYHDVRILIGRTYAWERDYDKSIKILIEVQRREPGYFDTYNALSDSNYWAGNYLEALNVINTGLSFYPDSGSFLHKKIEILIALNRLADAKKILADLKRIHPSHENLDELEKQLR